MTVPKHERLIERMTDAFWSIENNSRSITDPDRMRDVIALICTEFRKVPHAADDSGCLAWTAQWLETRLRADDAP
jgi:hypothetical protein